MKKRVTINITIIILALVWGISSAHAEKIVIRTDQDTIYFYDDFNIVGNTLTNNGVSGVGWSDRWLYVSDSYEPLHVNEDISLSYPSSSSAMGSGGYIEESGDE